MLETLRYTVLRLSIFVLCLLAARALGAKGFLALGIAAILSVLVSLLLLRRQREAMAAVLQRRIDARVDGAQHGRSAFARGVDADNEAEDR